MKHLDTPIATTLSLRIDMMRIAKDQTPAIAAKADPKAQRR